MPPTGDGPSGSLGNHTGTGRTKKKVRGPFSLATITRHEDEDEETRPLEHGELKLVDGYQGNFQTTITGGTKSGWGSKGRKGDNESEEELRMEASKVKSFLITEETV